MGNTLSWDEDPTVTGNPEFQEYLRRVQNEYESRTGKKINKVPTVSSPTPPVIKSKIAPKVQVGRLVSDFQGTLKDSTGDRTKYESDINYNALSDKEKKVADNVFARSETKRKAQVEKDVKDPYKVYEKTTADLTTEIKNQADADKKAAEEAIAKNKAYTDSFVSEETTAEESAFNTFQTTQNDLLKGYEGNRLNQVQGDLRRALLARGVDISKIPPEQLIALSGTIGAQAFSDISAAKEKATTAIETARQNKVAKVRQLKAQKLLSDSQYEQTLADINSKTASLKNNLDLKFAETVFGLGTQQRTEAKTDKQNAIQNAIATAQGLGIKGSQFGVVTEFLNKATSAESISAMVSALNDPNSAIYTILKSNEDAAKKAAQFENQIKLMEAQAKLKAASRPYVSPTDPAT